MATRSRRQKGPRPREKEKKKYSEDSHRGQLRFVPRNRGKSNPEKRVGKTNSFHERRNLFEEGAKLAMETAQVRSVKKATLKMPGRGRKRKNESRQTLAKAVLPDGTQGTPVDRPEKVPHDSKKKNWGRDNGRCVWTIANFSRRLIREKEGIGTRRLGIRQNQRSKKDARKGCRK